MKKEKKTGFFGDLGDPNNPINIFEKGETKFCPKCGAKIDVKAEICPKCGMRIKAPKAEVKSPGLAVVLSLLIVGFIVLVIIGSLSSDYTSTQNNVQPSASKSWHWVTSFSGKAYQNTASFYIKGEKVRITATTYDGSSMGTYSAINLKSENGGWLGPGLSIDTEGYEKGYGQTIYRNLDEGEYYISVISGVNWEVEVEEYY